jgi:hypothetical protein
MERRRDSLFSERRISNIGQGRKGEGEGEEALIVF